VPKEMRRIVKIFFDESPVVEAAVGHMASGHTPSSSHTPSKERRVSRETIADAVPSNVEASSSSSAPGMLENLPDDLLAAVLLACPSSTLLVLTATSHRIRAAAEQDALWLLKIQQRFANQLPLFEKAQWMPLPAPTGAEPCLVRGEKPKHFFFFFESSWTSLAAQGSEVGMGAGPGLCLLRINGRIYDATSYIDEHPGDPYLLRAAAGTDATDAFDFVSHSNHATSILTSFARPDLELPAEEHRLGKQRAAMLLAATSNERDGSRWGWWRANLSSFLERTLSAAEDKSTSRRHLMALQLLSVTE